MYPHRKPPPGRGLDAFFFFDKLGISTYINRGIYPVQKNLGFTLIELLVVVLIIGILSAVALPQYEKAVEKSRITEALRTIKVIEQQIDLYLMQNGWPRRTYVDYKDFASIDLTGGEWDDAYASFYTKNWGYLDIRLRDSVFITIERQSETMKYDLTIYKEANSDWQRTCFTQLTEIGRYMCRMLESSGWTYVDNEL